MAKNCTLTFKIMNLNFGSQDFATVREVYLNETFEAVKAFQKKNKLPLTGIVDERTYKMIMA